MDALESVRIESALAAQAERDKAKDEVGQDNFLTMLVAQLENQDPLNPQDSADFAAQLAQFSSVEQLVAMRAGIDELVASAATPPAELDRPAATSLDPTNLVGKEVTVFGSQIEVNAQGTPVSMDFRSIDAALEADVVIRNAEGYIVHEESILPRTADGDETYLPPGDHVYRFDPRDENLPEGVYSIEFTAKGSGDEDVTLLPMIQGLVTGAVLAGEPSIRMGNRIFSVQDVLEVRLPGSGQSGERGDGVGGSFTGFETGGGQTVYDRQPGAPRPTSGS